MSQWLTRVGLCGLPWGCSTFLGLTNSTGPWATLRKLHPALLRCNPGCISLGFLGWLSLGSYGGFGRTEEEMGSWGLGTSFLDLKKQQFHPRQSCPCGGPDLQT